MGGEITTTITKRADKTGKKKNVDNKSYAKRSNQLYS